LKGWIRLISPLTLLAIKLHRPQWFCSLSEIGCSLWNLTPVSRISFFSSAVRNFVKFPVFFTAHCKWNFVTENFSLKKEIFMVDEHFILLLCDSTYSSAIIGRL
jgi:hypothetical protein